jgi:tRNA(Ser,Leu) C12 N-acetylase TAN1
MIPVENNKSLFRDEKSGAIINCSDSDYQNYIKAKENKLKEIEKSKQLEIDVENIKKDIDVIKDLLIQLVSSKS